MLVENLSDYITYFNKKQAHLSIVVDNEKVNFAPLIFSWQM